MRPRTFIVLLLIILALIEFSPMLDHPPSAADVQHAASTAAATAGPRLSSGVDQLKQRFEQSASPLTTTFRQQVQQRQERQTATP